MKYKTCSICKKELELTSENFYKDKTKKDGFQNRCKQCCKEYSKSRKDYNKKYRQEHKEYFKEYNEQYKEYYKKYHKEYDKKYYQEVKKYKYDSEKKSKWNKAYRLKHPEAILNGRHRYRAKLQNQGNGITKEQWEQMNEFFEWCCAYSWIQLDESIRHIDHIIPISKGGLNEIWNMVPCYNKYNHSKNNKEPYKWYKQQEYYDKERLEYIIYYQRVMYWNFANKDNEPLILITGESITYEEIEEEYGLLNATE